MYFLAVVTLGCAPSALGQGEMIEVLMVGQVFPFETPVGDWLEDDPAFTYVVVPTRRDLGGWTSYPEKEAKRHIRLYFPRTYPDLTDYEFLCYVDTFFGFLTGSQVDWMHRGIGDAGLGGLTTLGGGISWVDEYRDSWVNSIVGDAFPTDYLQGPGQIQYVEGFNIVVTRGSTPPVFTPFLPLRIESQIGRQGAELSAKEGAITFATMESPYSTGMPFAVAWDFGEGRTWSVATDIQTQYNQWWTRWGSKDSYQYSMDLFLNMVLYSIKRDLVTDVLLYHGVRAKFTSYRLQKSMLNSVLDFVEKFGASRQNIDEVIIEVDAIEAEARDQYLSQRIEAADESLDRAYEELLNAEARAMVLKDRALLWVYIVEWTTVTATLMISGFALWSIMVRKRLYRVTGTTRMV